MYYKTPMTILKLKIFLGTPYIVTTALKIALNKLYVYQTKKYIHFPHFFC